jgi:hypothetical protein
MDWRDLAHLARSETVLAGWDVLRPALLALATVLAARILGGRGLPALAQTACGLGLLAGWFALYGVPPSAHVLTGAAAADQARLLALAVLVAALLVGAAPSQEPAVAAALALLVGWRLAGAPGSRAAVFASGPVFVAVSAAAWVVQRQIRQGGIPQALAAAAALAGGLLIDRATVPWLQLALVPLACATGQLAGGVRAGGLLAVGAGLAIAGAVIVTAAGRLPHGGFGVIDAACLAPLPALWLTARLGGARPVLGAAIGAAAGLGFAALAPRLVAWL